MALQLIEGFDNTLNGTPDFSARFSGAGVATSAGRNGGGYLSRGSAQPFVFPTALSGGVCGHAYLKTSGDLAVGSKLLSLYAGATEVCWIRVKSDNIAKLEIGTGASTVWATVDRPNTFLNVWNFLEVGWTIGAGTGTFQFAWNGVELSSLTGLAMGSANITELRWGNPGSGNLGIDDLYLLDLTGPAPFNARLGDCKVETLRPDGDGAASDWLGSDGNSLANWQLVDDQATTTDYVAAAATGLRDLYTLTNPSGFALGDVLAVQLQAYVAKSDAGVPPGPVNGVLRGGSGTVVVDQLASVAQLSTSYQVMQTPIKTTDPDGAAWTVTSLSNLQAGVEVPS